MITKTDQKALNFISDFHIATSEQICKLLYPGKYRYCMKRLQLLEQHGFIKRTFSTINNCHAYYIDRKPVQIHHDLIRAELFINLRQRYNVLSWSNEEPVKNIRPDATAFIQHSAFAYIDQNGVVFPIFIEIHLNNKFNFDKYSDLLRTTDLKELYGIMPRVIICTDRPLKLPLLPIKFKIVGLDMSGLDSLFR